MKAIIAAAVVAATLAGCAPTYYRPTAPYDWNAYAAHLSDVFFRLSDVTSRNAAALSRPNNNMHCMMMGNTMNCFSL